MTKALKKITPKAYFLLSITLYCAAKIFEVPFLLWSPPSTVMGEVQTLLMFKLLSQHESYLPGMSNQKNDNGYSNADHDSVSNVPETQKESDNQWHGIQL